MLDRYGFDRAFTFCMDEFDREPAFSIPNERTLAHAERAAGRFVPFVRLDLAERPLEEAHRCLDLGAKGIKLHPRAQAFTLDDERLAADLRACRRALRSDPDPRRTRAAADRGASRAPRVALRRRPDHRRPRGNRRHGRARRAARRDPGSVLRHVGLERVDLLDLYRQVSPEQIVYASDYPYGRQPNSLLMAFARRRRRLRRPAAARDARGERTSNRRPRAAARALESARHDLARPAAHVRAHPPVHLHGGPAALAAPARRDRRARTGGERLAGARRAPGRGGADPGAARDGPAISGARAARSSPTTSTSRRCGRPSSWSTSPT